MCASSRGSLTCLYHNILSLWDSLFIFSFSKLSKAKCSFCASCWSHCHITFIVFLGITLLIGNYLLFMYSCLLGFQPKQIGFITIENNLSFYHILRPWQLYQRPKCSADKCKIQLHSSLWKYDNFKHTDIKSAHNSKEHSAIARVWFCHIKNCNAFAASLLSHSMK